MAKVEGPGGVFIKQCDLSPYFSITTMEKHMLTLFSRIPSPSRLEDLGHLWYQLTNIRANVNIEILFYAQIVSLFSWIRFKQITYIADNVSKLYENHNIVENGNLNHILICNKYRSYASIFIISGIIILIFILNYTKTFIYNLKLYFTLIWLK